MSKMCIIWVKMYINIYSLDWCGANFVTKRTNALFRHRDRGRQTGRGREREEGGRGERQREGERD